MSQQEIEKHSIRQQYLDKRRMMSKEYWVQASAVINDALLSSQFYNKAETLLTYVSSKDNEVDTSTIIDCALQSGRHVLVPVVIPDAKVLSWAQISSHTELAPARFGLLEPVAPKFISVPDDSNAICLTPGIAFTPDGSRLGYGGGYYDRFLANFAGISVGLAFELQLLDCLPLTPYDKRVDYVLTEAQLYGISNGTIPDF